MRPFFILFFFFFVTSIHSQFLIIPEPESIDIKTTVSNINKDFTINLLSPNLTFEAEYLQKLLTRKGYNVI
ncbi:MAG: hypothetical protein RLZZ546_3091, partial [Bacteroidota bacterium]